MNKNKNAGQHVQRPEVDPVKIWFFITVGVVVAATVLFFLVLSGVR